VEGDEARLYTD